jgi:hypothetical protein
MTVASCSNRGVSLFSGFESTFEPFIVDYEHETPIKDFYQ